MSEPERPIAPAPVVPPIARNVSGKMRRAKGVRAEREVALQLKLAGLTVRNLEGKGDHLVFGHPFGVLHIEAKHHERPRIFEFLFQTINEAPEGTMPVLCFRRNRSEWFVALRLRDFLDGGNPDPVET